MTNLLKSILLSVFIFNVSASEIPVEKMWEIKKDAFVNAIIKIESNGNEKVSNNGCVGVLQIRACMVKEVNQILSKKHIDKRYTLEDRKNKEKSIEMFWIFQKEHSDTTSFSNMARKWNGGPYGYKSKRTLSYWNKVNKIFGRLLDENVKSYTKI